MNERTYTAPSNDYKYGFNGMERDDEVSGEGNSYTAEYWQYDPRLGRRFNVDPVVKIYLSPYAVLHNCPILFMDPLGDDDFFDSKGTYLGTTGNGKGSVIRIVNEGVTLEVAKTDLTKTKTLSELDVSKSEIGIKNRVLVTTIVLYYTGPIDIKKIGTFDTENEGKLAQYNRGTGEIEIAISPKGINKTLDDVNNLKTTLIHENEHFKDKSTSRQLYHYKAIVAEFKSESWENTSEAYKNGAIGYAMSMFKDAATMKNEGEYIYTSEQIQSEINVFNGAMKAAGFDYKLEYNQETRVITAVALKVDKKEKKDEK